MSMEASVVECLGSPAAIAETAVQEFRRRRNLLSRSWLAAFCTFALLPLPALCLAWTLTMLSLEAMAEAGKWCGWPGERNHEITPLLVFVGHAVMAAILVGPASLVAALFGRLARKTSHRWRWGIVASLLVSLVTTTATFSEAPGKSSIMFSVPFSGNARFWMSVFQPAHFGQFLLPLGVGVLILRRSTGGATQPAGRQPLSL